MCSASASVSEPGQSYAPLVASSMLLGVAAIGLVAFEVVEDERSQILALAAAGLLIGAPLVLSVVLGALAARRRP